jgi:hypothetical protein
MVAKLEQFQPLAGVNPVALGRRRKDLLEPRQFQIVDVEQSVAAGANQTIQRPCPAVVTLHRHRHLTAIPLLQPLDSFEKPIETFRSMDQVEFLQQLAARQTDRTL